MNDPCPTVSVVVTVYNQERYVEETLRSVLAQTYRDYEIVVVDDGSTDATAERVSALGSDIRLIRQANQGVAGSRNSGVLHARGRLVAFLDGDDLWSPDKLAHQVAAAARSPGAGLIAVNGTEIGNPSGLEATLFSPRLEALLADEESVTLSGYEIFLDANPIYTTSQVMIPRNVLEDVGPSDGSFSTASDWDLYIRISARYEIVLLRRRLATWRYLASSASGPRPIRQLRWGEDGIAVLRKHLASVPVEQRPLIESRIQGRILKTARIAYEFGKKDSRAVARRHLLHLLRRNPDNAGTVFPFLAGLYCPEFMLRSLGWVRRREKRTAAPAGP